MSLGSKIRVLRKEKGLSQAELGKLAGVHAKLIGKYENEQVVPNAQTLRGLASGLEVSADYLLYDGVPRQGRVDLKDLDLYERFREAERFDEADREALKRVLDAMIVKKKIEAAVAPVERNQPVQPWQQTAREISDRIAERTAHIPPKEKERLIGQAVRAVRKARG